MPISDYPRLCGGTFFTLVLQALRQRMKAREYYKGDSDGLTDAEVLAGLIQVANPDYTNPGKEALKSAANNYKACRISTSAYLPLDDRQLVQAFDARVQNRYSSVLSDMSSFASAFLDLGDTIDKKTALVRALVDLILKDESIGADEEFYVEADGGKRKKAALGDLESVCLPAFLLGVWHYVIVCRQDNSVGQITYVQWCPSNGRGPRKYSANMGEGILGGIRVYMKDTEDNPTVAMDDAEPIEAEIIDEIPQTQSVQQTVTNPFIFNFTQNGNNNTQIGHIGHYHAGKKED